MAEHPDRYLSLCVQNVILTVRYTVLSEVHSDLCDRVPASIANQVRHEMVGPTGFSIGIELKFRVHDQLEDPIE